MTYEISEIKNFIATLSPQERIDPSVLALDNLKRMAATASLIPKATKPGARLIDIGGTIYWVPIYAQLLGYQHITILERPGGGFFGDFQIPGQGEEFIVDTVEADAELDRYPIPSESVDCVVCLHLLEHLAGDPMHLIVESNRILKPNAFICLATPNVLHFGNVVRFLFGGHPFGWSVYTDSYADRHNREYTPMEVQKLFEAGGFSVELLQTKTYKPIQNFKIKLLGHALCLPAALTGHVSLSLRGAEIQVRARKINGVKERYPKFLYNLYGASAVTIKIRN